MIVVLKRGAHTHSPGLSLISDRRHTQTEIFSPQTIFFNSNLFVCLVFGHLGRHVRTHRPAERLTARSAASADRITTPPLRSSVASRPLPPARHLLSIYGAVSPPQSVPHPQPLDSVVTSHLRRCRQPCPQWRRSTLRHIATRLKENTDSRGEPDLIGCHHDKTTLDLFPIRFQQALEYRYLVRASLVIKAKQHNPMVRMILPIGRIAEILVVRNENSLFLIRPLYDSSVRDSRHLIKHAENIMTLTLQPTSHSRSSTFIHQKPHLYAV